MHASPKSASHPGAAPRARKSTLETLPPGTRFGRYELLRRLAVGGMAELYLARATGIEGFEKLVALKRILPQNAENDDFVRMFLDEARLSATIQHANVAQVYDIGRCDDGLFFTMEYVHGEDLRTLMQTLAKRGRSFPLEHALAAVIGACAGLHAAHERRGPDGRPLGIVHRDVSPSNVLVSYDGCVKLIDFGIAKAQRRQTETRAGTLKGKIAYMSPEQCMGVDLDRRSDVFSLGVVLYELTTGVRLFPVENEYAALRQIVDQDAPPPSRRKQGYPPELEQIVLRALRRDRAERYASAEELQLDLEQFVRTRGLAVSSAQLGYFMRELFPARALEQPTAPPPAHGPPPMAVPVSPIVAPAGAVDLRMLPLPPPRRRRRRGRGRSAAARRAAGAGAHGRAGARRRRAGAAQRGPVGTWMFRADGAGAAAMAGAGAAIGGDEPSIQIERPSVVGRGSSSASSIVDPALLSRQRRLHVVIAAGVAASISAVVAAVIVMLTRPAAAPEPAAPPPWRRPPTAPAPDRDAAPASAPATPRADAPDAPDAPGAPQARLARSTPRR
ncbi:MAG: serine/threonine protein kinase [Kofleriaceae bacterium]|nr:serine/threonine protein kinase [Kofleriaceae bacterium]